MLKNYVSEIDQDLQVFDKQHPVLSLSQQKEREKYARIYFLRDNAAQSASQANMLWKDF